MNAPSDVTLAEYLDKEVVQLGGLWADLDWNVSDEDVRALRRQVTNQLLKKI